MASRRDFQWWTKERSSKLKKRSTKVVFGLDTLCQSCLPLPPRQYTAFGFGVRCLELELSSEGNVPEDQGTEGTTWGWPSFLKKKWMKVKICADMHQRSCLPRLSLHHTAFGFSLRGLELMCSYDIAVRVPWLTLVVLEGFLSDLACPIFLKKWSTKMMMEQDMLYESYLSSHSRQHTTFGIVPRGLELELR